MTAHDTATRRDTLASLLDELVTADPGAAAALDVVDGEPVVTSRTELRARVDALKSELLRVGVRRGQCVAVLLPNWSDAIVWQLAASAVGAHVIGVNTRYNTHEIAHILTSARPAVVAVADHFHGLDLFGRLEEAQHSLDLPAPAVAVVHGPERERRPRPGAIRPRRRCLDSGQRGHRHRPGAGDTRHGNRHGCGRAG